MTEIVDRLRPRLELPGLELSVVSGPDLGKKVDAQRGTLRVGASRDNDLVLTDPSVSRRHFQVHLRAGTIQVEDLGSTNGTTIDGVRILSALLAPGSLIQLGHTAIRATSADRPLEIALSTSTRFGALLGASVEMRRAFSVLERVAPTDATVLIHGETGTGKELAAEAIHTHSPRADAPFVTFDCSAVAPSLVESELFGHVRGAFSGAVADRSGVFEAAHGGTLFLDEIGELPLELQPKLLRVLESRQVSRVGESRWRPFDVRVIAATHRELAAEVNRGRFREDLYFRLAVVSVTMPALRTRMDDLPMLVRHFYERFAPGSEAPPELVRTFASRAWPGNVRELRNALERAVVLREHGADDGPAVAHGEASAGSALPADFGAFLDLPIDQAQERFESTFWRAYLERALAKSGGSVSGAARAVGTNRRYIQRLMRRFDVRAPGDDDRDDG
ncbi:MAG: sigma 54-interacting transcriptional regulator [Myxococcota bacterium]|nr:sigma 54-interacting transcriptional regulator [Myxococcota bacterium]